MNIILIYIASVPFCVILTEAGVHFQRAKHWGVWLCAVTQAFVVCFVTIITILK
jgi:hypothetical protein